MKQSLPSRALSPPGAGMKRAVVEGRAPTPRQTTAIRMEACNSWTGLGFPKERRFMQMKAHHLGASLEALVTLGAGSPFALVSLGPHVFQVAYAQGHLGQKVAPVCEALDKMARCDLFRSFLYLMLLV